MSWNVSPVYAQPTLPNTEPMVLVYDTTLGSKTILAPFVGIRNITIDWGDGAVEEFKSTGSNFSAPNYHGFYAHTYLVDGIYTVSVYGTAQICGTDSTESSLSGISFTRNQLVRCLSFGNLGSSSMRGCFAFCPNLVEVPATLPATVTNLQAMFRGATSFNQNIGGWDVSKVTIMAHMFRDTSFNQDISGWNVSKVTAFGGQNSGMFQGNTAFNQNIGGWNVSSGTNFRSMFTGATSFNQNIGGWDVSSVASAANFGSMFTNASSFNQNLTGWCVGSALTEPLGFSTGSALTVGNKPIWGTCPIRATTQTISFIGGVTGITSATLPAHQPGDLIIAFACSTGQNPQIPIGWTQRQPFDDLSMSITLATKVAVSSNETTGLWPNSRGVLFAVYRNAVTSNIISFTNPVWGAGSGTSVTYSTNNVWSNLTQTVVFLAHLSINQTNTVVPSGITSRIDSSSTCRLFMGDSNGLTSGFTTQTLSVGGTSNLWRTLVLRLLPSL